MQIFSKPLLQRFFSASAAAGARLLVQFSFLVLIVLMALATLTLAGLSLDSAAAARAPSEVRQTRVALTLDDIPAHGPEAPGLDRLEILRRILAAVEKHGIRGVTAFANGRFSSETEKRVLREWVAAGHLLANHTYSHLDYHSVSTDAFFEDIRRNEAVLREYLDDSLFKVFRFPSIHEGETLAKFRAAREFLRINGYRLGHITIGSDDAAWTSAVGSCLQAGRSDRFDALADLYVDHAMARLAYTREATRNITRVIEGRGREIDQIIVIHFTPMMALTLDRLLTEYGARGVRWITLGEALEDAFYTYDEPVVKPWGTTIVSRVMEARRVPYPAGFRAVPRERIAELDCTGLQ